MIDAHLHVWDRERSSYAWLANAPAELQPSHGLEDATRALSDFGFEASVLVQADETLAETEFLLGLAAATPSIAGAVCYLPLEQPKVLEEHLNRLSGNPNFVGVRNLTHDQPDPDWLLGSAQRSSLRLLEAAGVPLDYLSVLPRHLENLLTLATEHPDLTFVLDHLGKPPIGVEDDVHAWTGHISEVAQCPNVVAKISGIYRADTPAPVTPDQMQWVLQAALDAFGADRLMLGSDWPVCTAFGGADATLRTLIDAVGALPESQAVAVRQETAARVYGLELSSL